MQTRDFPFGGTYVSGTSDRAERGAYAVPAASRPLGTYTGVPTGSALGRFVDVAPRRRRTATGSVRTATGSVRTATGSFRTA
ncbi:hypothetical protein Csp2054_01660 [Curtobacterium sp. 'Ferrero']|uniref:hypothetical protein n=1 Tax=Curtobacterium sp. 'Ferrero' TaxID=2033654 RepID=UPI000BDAA543|nr:hypothetical protein [Curtobacterium sp. 'Ferrero']PCN49672.1 hypothetical protein Csp2054_01660 [Curtobacterium sp. 'Ferrero']